MAEKKYYWLRLQRDFFKRHDIRIIEEMENGKDYLLFYLKLLVESIDHEGNLRFSDTVPYNDKMLSVVTNTNVDIVRAALNVFSELNMIEILEDSTIYMTEVEKMIGSAADNDNAKDINTPTPPAWEEDKHTNLENFEHLIETEMNEVRNTELLTSIKEWLAYKDNRKPKRDNHYQLESIRKLANRAFAEAKEHGTAAVVGVIDTSIMNNYQGIIWDSLDRKTNKTVVQPDIMKL